MKHLNRSKEFIGGLSKTTKMPCYSWNLPAEECKIGSKLREIRGSTCSHCYAMKGHYTFSNVQKSLYRRLHRLRIVEGDIEKSREFVNHFAFILNSQLDKQITTGKRVGGNDARYFRWFDSGDLQSVNTLHLIADIAEATPGVQHWLPTRESKLVEKFGLEREIPENLIVRVSAHMIGKPSAEADRLGLPGSAVHRHGKFIPEGYKGCSVQKVTLPNGSEAKVCGDCRDCWDDLLDISYKLH